MPGANLKMVEPLNSSRTIRSCRNSWTRTQQAVSHARWHSCCGTRDRRCAM